MAAPPTNQVSSLLQANSDESGTCRISIGGAPSPWAIGLLAIGYGLLRWRMKWLRVGG